MTKHVKRSVSILLTVLMVVGIFTALPITASAATGVTYLDANGATQTCSSYTAFTGQRDWGAEGETTWYVAESNYTFNTPSTWGADDPEYFFLAKADVHLIIKDGVKITVGAFGIKVASGSSLTIYSQSTGSNMGEMYINGTRGEGYFSDREGCPGIDCQGATLTINGGKITGQAGRNRIGIDCGSDGHLIVNGGDVYAYSRFGNMYAGYGDPEAIGGVNSNIEINGGHVYAEKDQNTYEGCAVGCQPRWGYSNIAINGGFVEAYAPGISRFRAFDGTLTIADDLYVKAGNWSGDLVYVESYGGQPSAQVRALVPVTGLSIPSTLDLNVSGPSSTLTPVFTPSDATFNEGRFVTWESSDESIATVDENGTVTPGVIPPGTTATATITAVANNGTPDNPSDDKSATCLVTLRVVNVSGVTLDYSSINMKTNGYSAKLVPSLAPDDASYKSTAWSSSDESVAAVDQNGIVTPGQPGTANIIYTADNGSPDDPSDDKTTTCKVTVTKPTAVSYLDYDADSDSFKSKSTDDYTTLIDSLSTITNYTAFSNNLAVLGKADETHWYYVDHDVTFDRMYANGDVHPILKNGVTMKANLGISVDSGNSLTIYVQSEDTATAGKLVTGSGLNANKCSLGTGGNITINGGTISAAGGFSGVGIQGTITINGGNITVRAADYWAVGMSGTITVNGGYISAQGYHQGINAEPAKTGTLITADKMVVFAGDEDNPTNPVRNPGWACYVLIHEAVPVEGVTADPLELYLNGPSETIQVHFSPENASYYTTAWLTFESDNPDVASVDQNGVVTPGVVGTATITITASNGTETTDDDKTTTCTVNVSILDVSEITLDKTSVEMMVTDAAVKLKPTIAPQYATYRTADMITWSSDNPAAATVDKNGNVTPHWEGTATITATAVNGTPDDPSDDKTATCTVTVSMNHVTGVSLDKTEINMSEYHKPVKLMGTIEPSDASFKTFKWVSDDPEIATVDQNGTVTPVSAGTTKIRFIADNGSPDDTSDDKTAVCDVTLFTPDTISYLEYDAQSGTFSEVTTSAYSLVYSDDTSWGTSKTQWYYVNENITINNSVKVNGNVNLIHGDNATLTVNGGILVNHNDNANLTIYAQSQNEDTMGKLITTGGSSCSGIGGAFGSYRGYVTINGSMITATGGQDYSGINAFTTINGGVVTATGQNGAGIDANYITINGGNVTATGDQNGSGINGYSVVINRGVVTATAGSSGAKAITYRNNVYIYKGLLVDAGSDAETSATVYDYATNDNYPYVFIRPNPDYTGIYNIAVDSENGTTTVTKDGYPVTSALFGSTITVDVEPASECKFLSFEVVICDENGDVVEPKRNVNVTTVVEGSQYTFVMPEENVKIVATYVWFDTLVAGHSISLDGDIGINFYMELSDYIINCNTAYMHFTIPNGNGTTTYDVPVSEAKVVESGDKKYYVFKCPVAAKEMTASVKAQLTDGTLYGTEHEYSVKDYADYLLEHANENEDWEKAVPVVKAMLNYGAYSQLYFDKNTGELANANLTAEEKELGDVTIDIDYYPVFNPFDEATFVGATLSLRSETTLSLYFKSSDELTFSGLDVEKETSGDYQIARIRGIKAAQLGDILMLTITGSNYQYSMRYSPMYYCKNVLADDTQDEKLRNVVKALYLYWQAAASYFGDVENIVDLGELEGDYEVQNGDVLTGTLVGNKKITVANGATVTLRDVNITSLDNADYPGITLLGSATIILKGNNIVKGGLYDGYYNLWPGIYVPENNRLEIKGEGSLTASCGDGEDNEVSACGIGGGVVTEYLKAGYIYIMGGTVTAIGGPYAAGIGCSMYGSVGTIIIRKTVTQVTATKGECAPKSIGEGEYGNCGMVWIDDGANVIQN